MEIGKDSAQKRLWTVSLFKACLYYVLSEKQVLVPLTSDFTIESWVQEQSKKLHQLVGRAAKIPLNAIKLENQLSHQHPFATSTSAARQPGMRWIGFGGSIP